MFSQFFGRLFSRHYCSAITFFVWTLFVAMPLWAQEGGATDEPQIWVLSYALMLLCLTLALVILLRPTKRSDSAFSHDEQQALREAEMKKMKGGH